MTSIGTPRQANGALTGATGTWTLDPAATTIAFQTRSMWGLAKVAGSFQAVEGDGTVRETGALQGTMVVDASSVDTGNKIRDRHLRSADFLESDNHSTFVFAAREATAVGEDKVKMSGTLTVRGQTRPFDIVTTVLPTGADTVALESEFEIDRSQWGISWTRMGAKVVNKMTVSASFTRN
ncbi:MAG: YceI family protein [Acidimicrobiales bacterium]